MNSKLLPLIESIKDNLRDLDDEGVEHPLLEKVYEQLTEVEDIIYESDNSDDSDVEFYD
jgi:hypothetical protein